YDEYAEFVGKFAARYRDSVHLIVPWNEPNLMFEWGDRQVTPEEYVRFLKLVHDSAHTANPDVIILGGALAPTLEPEDSAVAMNELDYLRRMYEAGGAESFDALAVHTYGFTMPLQADPAPDQLNWRRVELLIEIMKRYGDGDKPVYITESGWNDHPRWKNAVSPGERIQYTLDALRWTEANYPQVRNLCLWYFRSPFLTRSYPDYYALVTPEFRLRPIYDALRDYAQGKTP
ncbi:MAG: hypothetical protein KF726_06715, partial [Anaerolineae bacterium]|nr:hypothetical protein [Anaerolineae bacterium]